MRWARPVLAWSLVLPLVGWAVLLLLDLDRAYVPVVLVAFTPYAMAGGVAALLLILALRRWRAALVAAIALGVLVAAVAPRAIKDGEASARAAGRPFVVLTLNTRRGGASADSLAGLAASSRADVVSLQELTPGLVRALDARGFARRYRHRVLQAVEGTAGTGLYARRPLRPLAGPRDTGHRMTVARLRLGRARHMDLLSVHPVAPRRPGDLPLWRRGLRTLSSAGATGRPRILAGDFNATLDHTELRRLLDRGYADAAAQTGAGLVHTWPVGRRLPPPVTIDHVLVGPGIAARRVSVHTIPGTDHRAVVAVLDLPES